MNGKEITSLQLERGTRAIVECLDEMRISCGFDRVILLTPIVEIKLRSGFIPAKELSFAYRLEDSSVNLIFTIPNKFPNQPIEVTIESNVDYALELQDQAQQYSSDNSEGSYPKALEIKNKLFSWLQENNKLISTETELITKLILKAIEDDNEDSLNKVTEPVFYACRTCRTCLLDNSQLNDHSRNETNKCTSYFLEDPPHFLTIKSDEETGKLNCPKCGSRIGNWSWIGNTCSCGKWITPAFQFTKSKLDIKRIV